MIRVLAVLIDVVNTAAVLDFSFPCHTAGSLTVLIDAVPDVAAAAGVAKPDWRCAELCLTNGVNTCLIRNAHLFLDLF